MEAESYAEPPADTRIWRYMDFVKFVAMLERGGLYFSRADLLGDPFEGTFTPGSIEALTTKLGYTKDAAREWSEIVKHIRKNSYVSCWHESEDESAALWRLYGNTVAIRSTCGKLRAFLPDHCTIAHVRYIDYKADHPDVNYSAGPLLFKRRAFTHEREIRALWQTFTYEGSRRVPYEHGGFPGEYVEGDLNLLVDCVVAAPQSPRWFVELVYKVTTRYSLKAICISSDLDVAPPF
jgi:hypothetical protein